ncbi:hypothetical protein ONZ45_g16177 [Pleurotus djamor]|nr:hypothetical protein ONZ45_g16177 [Pleurotus djamor]
MPTLEPSRCSDSEIRDPKLYFDDGSVVLSSRYDPDEDGTQVTYFRVHKTLLANASAIFRDMFQLPQPSESTAGEETYDGVPLIVLHDKTTDLRGFLRVLYDPIPIFTEECGDTLGEIAGSLKLARKYEASPLYEQLIKLIQKDWPAKQKDWIARNCFPREPPSAEALIRLSWTSDARHDLRFPLALAYYDLSVRGLKSCNQSLLNMEDVVITMDGYKEMISWLMGSPDNFALGTKFSHCNHCESNIRTPADFVLQASGSPTGPLEFIEMEQKCLSCPKVKKEIADFLGRELFAKLPCFFLVGPD